MLSLKNVMVLGKQGGEMGWIFKKKRILDAP